MKVVSTLAGTARTLWSEDRGPVLVTVATGWFLSMGVRMIFPALLPELRAAYGMSLARAGLLISVVFVMYAIGQLPGGILANRIGEGRSMVVSTALSGGALLLVVAASTQLLLFFAVGVFGFATGTYAVARFTALNDLYPQQVGTAIGLTAAAADAGQSSLPVLAAVLTGLFVWQSGFGFAMPLFASVAVLLWVFVPARTSNPPVRTDDSSLQRMRRVLAGLRTPAVLYSTTALIIGVCIWQAFTSLYPTYLVEIKGLSVTRAGSLLGVFFALGILVQPVSGGAYDRFGARATLYVALGTAGASLFVFPFAQGFPALLALTVAVSSLLGFATVLQSYLIRHIRDDIQETGFGFLRTVSFLIGAASPVLFGAAADRGYFDHGFVVLAGLAAVMMLVVSRLPPEG